MHTRKRLGVGSAGCLDDWRKAQRRVRVQMRWTEKVRVKESRETETVSEKVRVTDAVRVEIVRLRVDTD